MKIFVMAPFYDSRGVVSRSDCRRFHAGSHPCSSFPQLFAPSLPVHLQNSQPLKQPLRPRSCRLRCSSVAASIAPDIDTCSVPAAAPLVTRIMQPLLSLRLAGAGITSAV